MFFINTLVVLLTLATRSTSDTKVWTYTTAIDDPKNWIDGKVQKDCNGLVFPKVNDLPVFIKNLNIKQMILPVYGTIWFEDESTISFDEESTDDLNCVKLIPNRQHYWYFQEFWMNMDNPDNPAIPFSEQLPCKYDDVVLPQGFNSSISLTENPIFVKSVTFGDERVTQQELNDLTNSDAGIDVFLKYRDKSLFTITGEMCTDPTGCDRRAAQVQPSIMEILGELPNIQCYDSIDIMGNFMEPICGAQILISTLKMGFTINRINKKLDEYKSYTHASKYDPPNIIQIIFTEKEFTGLSLMEAAEFYNVLREDESYFSGDITLSTSGPPLYENKVNVRNAFSILFGTLFGAILMFGLVFFVYSPTVANLNLRNRLRSARPLSTYILRYDNIDDRADIIDGQSMAGSVLALNRAFENPLYDQASSTRSTSNETIMSRKLEEDDNNTSDRPVVVDSAQELEDIDLHGDESSSKNDNVLLQDL